MEGFFLGCFLFGALYTLGAVVLGAAAGGHGDAAGHGGHGLGQSGHDLAAGDGAASGHGAGHHDGASGQPAAAGAAQSYLPVFNLSSFMAFLTWFGGAGYVLLKVSGLPLALVLAGAALLGVGGAALVALFLRSVLAGERVLDPRDYRLEGTVARVTVSIPADGTGEIVFVQAGARRSEAARSLSGRPIPRGAEVVVMGYERGVATVRARDEAPDRIEPDVL